MKRTWPSRRLQLIVIAVLIIGAALRVFWQPLTPKGKAEKLYMDSCFVGSPNYLEPDSEGDPEAAIALLERALKLSPANSLYEQALVWQYDPEKLPDLLKKRHLGPKARRLAAGLYEQEAGYPDDKAGFQEDLRRLAALQKADPTNSVVRYRRAHALQELGRMDEALAELRAGNRLGPMRLYAPELPRQALDACSSPMMSLRFGDFSSARKLALALSDLASQRLRQGKVQEACAILETCVPLSVNVARSEPPTFMAVYVGWALFGSADGQLKPIYKDFGMKDRLAALDQLDGGFCRARESCRTENRWDLSGAPAVAFALPASLVGAPELSLAVLVLAAIIWIPAVIARRVKRQDALIAPPWGTGFIARICLPPYALLLAWVIVASYVKTDLVLSDVFSMDIANALFVAVGALEVIFLVLVLRVLHHRYDEHTGERTGILRFISRAPANAKAWTRKYVMVALGGQIVFAACCFLLAIIVYKPIFGGHPWQVNRFRVCRLSHEQAAVRRIGEDLRKAGLVFPPWEKQKKWR